MNFVQGCGFNPKKIVLIAVGGREPDYDVVLLDHTQHVEAYIKAEGDLKRLIAGHIKYVSGVCGGLCHVPRRSPQWQSSEANFYDFAESRTFHEEGDETICYVALDQAGITALGIRSPWSRPGDPFRGAVIAGVGHDRAGESEAIKGKTTLGGACTDCHRHSKVEEKFPAANPASSLSAADDGDGKCKSCHDYPRNMQIPNAVRHARSLSLPAASEALRRWIAGERLNYVQWGIGSPPTP